MIENHNQNNLGRNVTWEWLREVLELTETRQEHGGRNSSRGHGTMLLADLLLNGSSSLLSYSTQDQQLECGTYHQQWTGPSHINH